MMKKILVLVILLSVFFLPLSVSAEEKPAESPGIIIGITGIFGTSTIDVAGTDVDFEPGYIMGGGLILQKSLTDHFSAGTGFQYRYFNCDFTAYDETTSTEFDATWTFNAISIPFHLIATVKGPASSLDIHAGATYTYIYSSEMSTNDTLPSGIKDDDVMRFTSSSQVGVSGGFIFRFMVTEYTDFFMGVMAEYYPTNLITDSDEGESFHLLNYSFNTGYMFRTDFF